MTIPNNDAFIVQAERRLTKLLSERDRISEQITSLNKYLHAAGAGYRKPNTKARRSGVAGKVLAHMQAIGGPITSRQASRDLDMPVGSVSSALTQMGQAGTVKNDGSGRWSIITTTPRPPTPLPPTGGDGRQAGDLL